MTDQTRTFIVTASTPTMINGTFGAHRVFGWLERALGEWMRSIIDDGPAPRPAKPPRPGQAARARVAADLTRGFLVGEPQRHADAGVPYFTAFRCPPGGEYQTGSRPLSVSEFRVAVVQ